MGDEVGDGVGEGAGEGVGEGVGKDKDDRDGTTLSEFGEGGRFGGSRRKGGDDGNGERRG